MKQSGTKLVLGLACLAVAAGVASWSYRYGATHRATQFWGGEVAPLIARPSQAEFSALRLADDAEPAADTIDLGRLYVAEHPREITDLRGMVHFRHALMSDGNYLWTEQPAAQNVAWRWCLRFYDEEAQARIVLDAELATIGLVADAESGQLKVVSCRPMAETLQDYFGKLGLLPASTAQ
ncbi:MAG: hypothetical protein KDA57_00565 [Planctomycetales bacterium]|nr:hypothetical protein [Planctomycetales bacterium]